MRSSAGWSSAASPSIRGVCYRRGTIVEAVLDEATIARPPEQLMQTGGRAGRHTEHLGFILADMQFLQRAYPRAKW